MIDLPAEWLLAASDDIDAAEKLLSESILLTLYLFIASRQLKKHLKLYWKNTEKTLIRRILLKKLFTKVNKYLTIAIDETIGRSQKLISSCQKNGKMIR